MRWQVGSHQRQVAFLVILNDKDLIFFHCFMKCTIPRVWHHHIYFDRGLDMNLAQVKAIPKYVITHKSNSKKEFEPITCEKLLFWQLQVLCGSSYIMDQDMAFICIAYLFKFLLHVLLIVFLGLSLLAKNSAISSAGVWWVSAEVDFCFSIPSKTNEHKILLVDNR